MEGRVVAVQVESFGRVKDRIKKESLIKIKTIEGRMSKTSILGLLVQSVSNIILENAAKEPTSSIGVENLVI